ncbi:MAG: replication-associated recombination protein A [Flavobacteriales bacterium]
MNQPLAERMRPRTLLDYLAQTHLTGDEGVIKKVLEKGLIPSMIFWGPPGTGKTTLAQIIAEHSERPFFQLSAISSGVKDIREVIDKAKNQNLFSGKNPILFIDEIHRFNKSQQDSLLGAVEKGWVTLIGATTENPSFEVVPALLSRCQVYTLNHFSKEDLNELLIKAVEEDIELKKLKIQVVETEALFRFSGGDARKLLNGLELVINSLLGFESIKITDKKVLDCIQQNMALYDKAGEQHYDVVSAFIKSIRGSDPNAAVYWLARMIEGGEDVKFIARRLLILASEDVGNANPTALIMANNTFQAVTTIGYPESRIILSQCVIYLATSPKSNSAYKAINEAQQLVKQTGNLSVPLNLRNAPTQLMKELNYGVDYQYSHDYPLHFVEQEFLPKEISGTTLYKPAHNNREKLVEDFLRKRWKKKYGY